MSMIQIEHLSKSFSNLDVLRNVSLTVEKGERIVIIGGSGCGKSVFLRSIELLEKPDAGRIFICGQEITAKNANLNKIRQHMGMVYQGFHLFENMNILDNITLAPVRLKKIPKTAAEEKAVTLLRMVGLENRKYDMPAVLSGGQKQRAAIARCLAMEPDVLLFDEPTSALDPSMAGEVLATMRLLAGQNMTMIIVTHEMSFAREIGTRILYFDDCGIYEQGTPEEIFEHPQLPKTQVFIHKLKHFFEHISSRNFDLTHIHDGIEIFAQKYGLSAEKSYRIRLCSEELIMEMIENCFAPNEKISVDISVEYSELEHTVQLQCSSGGRKYNPFDTSGTETHLGVLILNKTAEKTEYSYDNGQNVITATI